MPRKPAVRLLKSIARLRAEITTARGPLTSAFAERSTATAGFSYGSVLDHFDGELSEVEADLAKAETDYEATGVRLVDLRYKRARASSRLYDRYSPIENFCRSQPHLRGTSIVGAKPESPGALVHQVAVTLEFLRDFASDAAAGCGQPPLTPGVSIDAGELAGELESGLPPLEDAIARVEQAEAAVSAAKERADRAFAEADKVTSWVGRALESLSGLAGEEGLVRRIRKCGG